MGGRAQGGPFSHEARDGRRFSRDAGSDGNLEVVGQGYGTSGKEEKSEATHVHVKGLGYCAKLGRGGQCRSISTSASEVSGSTFDRRSVKTVCVCVCACVCVCVYKAFIQSEGNLTYFYIKLPSKKQHAAYLLTGVRNEGDRRQ